MGTETPKGLARFWEAYDIMHLYRLGVFSPTLSAVSYYYLFRNVSGLHIWFKK